MNTSKSNPPGKQKETYKKPLLTNYGYIARLTRTATGNLPDAQNQNFNHQTAGGGS